MTKFHFYVLIGFGFIILTRLDSGFALFLDHAGWILFFILALVWAYKNQ